MIVDPGKELKRFMVKSLLSVSRVFGLLCVVVLAILVWRGVVA